MTQIVQINVSQTVAPTPSTLQRTGALISQGGTTLTPGAKTLITQPADLTPILQTPKAITSLAWATGVVTVTTTAPHGYANGTTIGLTIAGAAPAAYNGTFQATITGTSTFTYPLVNNPVAATVQGTVVSSSVAELTSMATTFYAQGAALSVYVLELGAVANAAAVTALGAYITNNPGTIYSYEVPRAWADEASYVTFVANYSSNTSKTYFFTRVTEANESSFPTTVKSVFKIIEAPTISATEFTAAAPHWVTLNYNPSPANQVTPLCFAYLQGVTAFPATGPQQTTFKTDNVNYVTTGAEGGISNLMLLWGRMSDSRPFNYWYSVDWVQINLQLSIANEIINGSNNPLAPLYYNQAGINRLQARAAKTMTSAVSYGLALGQVITTALPQAEFVQNLDAGKYAGQIVINAIPFAAYSALNPSDYKDGVYSGLSAVYTPARGFEQIIFNLNVTDFVA